MGEANSIQAAFVSGEISPLTLARVDVQRFYTGAEIVENFHVTPQGGVSRRSGMRYVGRTADDNKGVIVPFVFAERDAYDLIFTHLKLEIWQDDTKVETLTTNYTEDDLPGLRFGAQSADTMWLTHKMHKPRILVREATGTWSLTDETFVDGPFLKPDSTDTTLTLETIVDRATLKSDTAGDFSAALVNQWVEYNLDGFKRIGQIKTLVDGETVEIMPVANIVDPTTIDPGAKLEYAASAGGLPDRIRARRQIWNTATENSYIKADGTWRLTGEIIRQFEEVPEVPGPPKEVAYSADVIEVASTPTMFTPAGVITFSDREITATLKASVATFVSSRDVGRQFRLTYGTDKIWGTIVSVVSTQEATVTINEVPPVDPTDPALYLNDGQTLDWQWGAWYVDNYPAIAGFHEARLVFGSTSLQSTTLFFSESDDFNRFSESNPTGEVVDANGFSLTFDSGRINDILWMVSNRVLLVGTAGGVWQVKPENIQAALTPANATQRKHIDVPCEPQPPLVTGRSVLYIQQGGNVCQEVVYSFENDKWISNELSAISEHILRDGGGVVDTAFQREPHPRGWFVLANGQLVSLTYNPSSGVQVVAWSRSLTNGTVEAVEVTPSKDGRDRLKLLVKRTIDGEERRFYERLDPDFHPTNANDKDGMFFVDCGTTVTLATAANTAGGFDHLKGEEVTILADGSVRPNATVDHLGQITFEGPKATVITAGMEYSSRVKSMPIEAGSNSGTAQGKVQRIHQLTLRVHESLGVEVGPSFDKLNPVSFRSEGDVMDDSPALFTGLKEVDLSAGYTLDNRYVFQQKQPYPLTVLGVMPQGYTYK